MTEIRKGSECGIQVEGFQDLEEGDVLQVRLFFFFSFTFGFSVRWAYPSSPLFGFSILVCAIYREEAHAVKKEEKKRPYEQKMIVNCCLNAR